MTADSARTVGNTKPSPEPVKEKKEKKAKAPKPRRQPPAELPLLVDLSYSLPVIVILMVDFAIIGFSYAAGTDWVTTLSRAMVATVVLGALMAIIAYVISSTALAETKERLEKEKALKEQQEKEKEEMESLNAEETSSTEIKA